MERQFGGIKGLVEFLFVIGRIAPSEIRPMSTNELRYWRDLIERNHEAYGIKAPTRQRQNENANI